MWPDGQAFPFLWTWWCVLIAKKSSALEGKHRPIFFILLQIRIKGNKKTHCHESSRNPHLNYKKEMICVLLFKAFMQGLSVIPFGI